MTEGFNKQSRILKSRDFQSISRHAKKKIGQYLIVEIGKNCNEPTKSGQFLGRLGITISRKFGKSHDRNRFKRLVRESFRTLRGKILIPFDIIVRPKFNQSELNLLKASLKGVFPKMADIREDLYEIITRS